MVVGEMPGRGESRGGREQRQCAHRPDPVARVAGAGGPQIRVNLGPAAKHEHFIPRLEDQLLRAIFADPRLPAAGGDFRPAFVGEIVDDEHPSPAQDLRDRTGQGDRLIDLDNQHECVAQTQNRIEAIGDGAERPSEVVFDQPGLSPGGGEVPAAAVEGGWVRIDAHQIVAGCRQRDEHPSVAAAEIEHGLLPRPEEAEDPFDLFIRDSHHFLDTSARRRYGPFMPRVARIVAPGVAHHITQRGNNRQDVFFADRDRRVYLELLREQAEKYGVAVRAYCLMTNHVHLIVTPPDAESLRLAVGRTHWRYTQHINRVRSRSGHLWRGRFFSCPVVGDHELAAMRYVERNPVRVKMVRMPWRYEWSSAAAHCGGKDATGLLDLAAWGRRFTPQEWRAILRDPGDGDETAAIRRATKTGRPLASDRWIAKMEPRLGRSLRARPVGRPPKEVANKKTKERSTRRSARKRPAGR